MLVSKINDSTSEIRNIKFYKHFPCSLLCCYSLGSTDKLCKLWPILILKTLYQLLHIKPAAIYTRKNSPRLQLCNIPIHTYPN